MTSPHAPTQHTPPPPTPQATPQAEEAVGTPEDRQTPTEEHHGGRVVQLHTAHPRVPIPYVTPGDMFSNARVPTSLLPSPRRLAFYGLLGGMTVAGAMAWPVAVAVGAATEVITREQSARHQQEHARMEEQERAEREMPQKTATG